MYKRGNLDPTSLATLARSLEVELDRLALQMSQPINYLALNTIYEAPKRIFEGMIVKADGTTWNPGSGAGTYQYRGGAWRLLG
jgi:hypothetical protein